MLIQNLSFDKVNIQQNNESPAWDFLRQYGGYGDEAIVNTSISAGVGFNTAPTMTGASELGTEYDSFAMVYILLYCWVNTKLTLQLGQRSSASYTGQSCVRTAITSVKRDPNNSASWPYGNTTGLRNSLTSRSFSTSTVQFLTSDDSCPADAFFLIGMSGPRYRTYKYLPNNRTAVYPNYRAQGGTPYFTLINAMWHSPDESTDPHGNGIPVDLGGTSTNFTRVNGYVPTYTPYFISF